MITKIGYCVTVLLFNIDRCRNCRRQVLSCRLTSQTSVLQSLARTGQVRLISNGVWA